MKWTKTIQFQHIHCTANALFVRYILFDAPNERWTRNVIYILGTEFCPLCAFFVFFFVRSFVYCIVLESERFVASHCIIIFSSSWVSRFFTLDILFVIASENSAYCCSMADNRYKISLSFTLNHNIRIIIEDLDLNLYFFSSSRVDTLPPRRAFTSQLKLSKNYEERVQQARTHFENKS